MQSFGVSARIVLRDTDESEKIRPETVSAFRTARLSHSRWLGVNESPAGTRATYVLAGVIALDLAATHQSLLPGVGPRVRIHKLRLTGSSVTQIERVAGAGVVAACRVDRLHDLVDGDHDEEDQDRNADEQRKRLKCRRIFHLRPPRERFQRH